MKMLRSSISSSEPNRKSRSKRVSYYLAIKILRNTSIDDYPILDYKSLAATIYSREKTQ